MADDLTAQTGFAVEDEPTFRGTLADQSGALLAGWTVSLRALDAGGSPLTPQAIRGTVADATGAFALGLPAGTAQVSAEAYHPEDDTHAIPCSLSLNPDGSLALVVPVKRRHGRAFLKGTTTLLKRHALAWRDTGDMTFWQGTVTSGEGTYALYEEQGRPYTVYAFSEVSKAWYVLDSTRDNADGSRDLYFALWSFLNHPFARRDNPLGGTPDDPRL